jgi:hypothetical protein
LNQLRESSYTLCWAAKWHGEKEVFFGAEWNNKPGYNFLDLIYELMDEADILVGYNHDHFDIKTLNKDFALNRGPYSPYQSVDLLKVVKQNFRLPSNKLEYVLGHFGLGSKVKHEGHTMWVKVMAGDPKAQKQMETYCKGDVLKTEKLYDKLLPWIRNHPNRSLYTGSECGRCEKGKLQKRGLAYTANGAFQTYRCSNCKGWSRDTKRIEGVDVRNI